MSYSSLTESLTLGAGRNRRTLVLAAAYVACICGSFYCAYELRFDFAVPEIYQVERLRLLPFVVAIKMVFLVVARQLGTLLTYFSIPDLLRLLWAMVAASLVLIIPRIIGHPELGAPRGVLLTDLMLCFGILCAGRVGLRLYRERMSGARQGSFFSPQDRVQLIAIVGAGDAGAVLAKEFIGHPSRGFRPVAFLDDDVTKHGRLIHGVSVLGRPEQLDRLNKVGVIAKAIIAMPSASARRVREIVEIFSRQGIKVETLPTMTELASGKVRASRLRPVEVQDLLGREAVNLDSAGIRHSIEGRVVMVTGAGGSIGSELCRQIAALNPKRLLMVEQAEGSLFLVEQEINEQGFSTIAVPLVADILDRERMDYIFSRYQPNVVFHAAAHKHVYLMERQPAEAIRNNVFGTRQLATLAASHGVDAFVLISTDKAINPTNVMGATKRLAELQLMAVAAAAARGATEDGGRRTEGLRTKDQGTRDQGPGSQLSTLNPQLISSFSRTKFMAVRFGNVLGSSGSVIPIFKRQIANGGPVTVTHPDVTRYFMTIPEAVGLVLQSFVLGKGGEIFVLDMGQPVKIVDLAKQMIELSGFRVDEDIEIKFTGLKPGEKLFEELQHHTEAHVPTEHPRIMRFTSQTTFAEASLLELDKKLHALDTNELKAALKQLVPEYTPFLD